MSSKFERLNFLLKNSMTRKLISNQDNYVSDSRQVISKYSLWYFVLVGIRGKLSFMLIAAIVPRRTKTVIVGANNDSRTCHLTNASFLTLFTSHQNTHSIVNHDYVFYQNGSSLLTFNIFGAKALPLFRTTLELQSLKVP